MILWTPLAAKNILAAFEKSKDITFAEPVVTLHAAVKAENVEQIKALAAELVK